MRIAFYTPFLDTAGGGEKYVLTIAEYLSQRHPGSHAAADRIYKDSIDSLQNDFDNEVDILLDSHLTSLDLESIKKRILDLHNLDLAKLNFVKAPLGRDSSPIKRLIFLKKYDFLFYLTDGSIFYSTAKKSILHLQSPIKNTNISIWGKIKLGSWKLVVYNSKFTQNEAQKSWPTKNLIIYPPVSVNEIKPLKKKKQILSVGRFFGYLKDKKHGLLIDSFKKLLLENNLIGWSLHLVGGAKRGDEPYLEQLKNQAKDAKIFLHPNLSFDKLTKLYGESKIYWHAAGFGETDPTKMEHFGISTVEAMAGGCVPVVVNAGGQPEIVEDRKSGYLWDSLDEMIKYTMKVILDSSLSEKLSKEAIKRSKMFSKDKFCKKILELVSKR